MQTHSSSSAWLPTQEGLIARIRDSEADEAVSWQAIASSHSQSSQCRALI